MTESNLRITLSAKDETGQAFNAVKEKTEGFGASLKRVGEMAGGFFVANVAGKALTAVTQFAAGAVGAAKESIQVNSQLEAVLKSTGGAAGVTADAARDLASGLEKMSLFEDEAVLGGENLLLTFTGIGKDVFPRATQTMADMSQALGQDMSASAIQLGKALNDPIEGITALSRVGVSFTDQQKEQIKTMVEAGDVAGAQGVILDELAKEFGGSAQAASDAAGASEVMKDRMNDLSEQLGNKMLPVNELFMKAQIALVDILVGKVIPAIESVVAFIQANWPTISAIFNVWWDNTKAVFEGVAQIVSGFVQIISGVVDLVSALFHGEWSAAWQALKDIASGALDILIGLVKVAFGSIPGIIAGFAGEAWSAAKNVGDRIAEGVGSVWEGIKSQASETFNNVVGTISNLAGSAYNAAFNFANGIYNAIRNVISGIVDWVRGQINEIIRAYNSIPLAPNVGQISGGGGYNGSYASDQGGVRNTRGGWARMNEGGAEMVFLPQGATVLNNRQTRNAMQGQGGVTVNINGPVTVNGKDGIESFAGDTGWAVLAAWRARGALV